MAHELKTFRVSVDVGDGLESPSHTPLETPSQVPAYHSDQEKLLPHNSPSKQQRQSPLLDKSLFRTLLSFSWLIHVIALGCTGAAVQLTFNSTYWADEADWEGRFFWSILRGTRIQDIIQFAAKLYEIIVVTSLSAMVLHALRRMLVGDGVAWGLMSGAYQVGSPSYFFSRELWAPFLKPGNPRNFLMAFGLASLVVYANMIGPFTAIILSPVLEWWPVPDPYNGEKLTSYVNISLDYVYPDFLAGDLIAEGDCNVYTEPNCPDSGFREVKNLIEAWAISNAKPVTEIKHSGPETTRELISSLDYSTEDEHLALATTLHSSVVELAGSFWNYLDSDETNLTINDSKRPRFTPDVDVYAPLVQVQCNQYSYSELRKTGGKPSFQMGRMRNFSAYSQGSQHDAYRTREDWEVPSKLWDFERENLGEITFEWVDVEALGEDGEPSIGAFVTVPMTRHETKNGNQTTYVQDSILLPCMIDARWAKAKTFYDPSDDNLMPNDLIDLTRLSPFWEDKTYHLKNLDNPNILILPEWAKYLNNPVTNVTSALGSKMSESTAMIWLLHSFLFPDNNEDWTFASFKTGNFTSQNVGGKADKEAARAVASTLSLALADGVSRVALDQDYGVVTRDNGDGTVECRQLWLQSMGGNGASFQRKQEQVQGLYVINWKAERKGWGYGFKSPAIIIGVVLLLMHAGLVVAFCAYVLWFRLRSHGWASGAWGGLSEMLGLAIASRRPSNHQLIRSIAEGEDKWNTMTAPVVVRTVDHEGIELLLGDVNHGSRLTVGRAYST
ncbi:hypothetical protein HJFPF1_10841 [Paramyrothecium foliicola]|nr:hypothetical protein HJFPF1_10841 [Paramyrothecium foliicola]